MNGQFIEVLLAPGYDEDALEVLQGKKNVRLLELADWPAPSREVEIKPVLGGLLVQDRDAVTEGRGEMRPMTEKQPSESQWEDLLFAWKVCRYVRSNAIVIACGGATIGIGAGQMSRVDSVRIAVEKAQANQPDLLAGAALASDAFFPFADGPELAYRGGRDVDHPAGWLGARRGRGRRRRCGGHRDGGDRQAPLPPLASSSSAPTSERSFARGT